MLDHVVKNLFQTTEKHSFLNIVLKTPSYTNASPPDDPRCANLAQKGFGGTQFWRHQAIRMLHHLLKNRFQTTAKHSFLNTVLKTPSYTNAPPPAQKSVPDHQKTLISEHCFEDTKLYESSTTCSKICSRPPKITHF